MRRSGLPVQPRKRPACAGRPRPSATSRAAPPHSAPPRAAERAAAACGTHLHRLNLRRRHRRHPRRSDLAGEASRRRHKGRVMRNRNALVHVEDMRLLEVSDSRVLEAVARKHRQALGHRALLRANHCLNDLRSAGGDQGSGGHLSGARSVQCSSAASARRASSSSHHVRPAPASASRASVRWARAPMISPQHLQQAMCG